VNQPDEILDRDFNVAALNKSGNVPLYTQVRNSLREDILNKVLSPGQKIPSEDDLAARFNVSRMTARQGILDLVDEGLLYRRYGVGTFVAQPHLERDHSRLTNSIEVAKADGIDFSVRLLYAGIIRVKLKVAQSLSLKEGDLVIRIKTLRFVSNLPITVHDAYVPYRLFPQILQEDLETRHLWEIFESYGHKVKRAIQRLEAREADEEISTLLGIDVGFPILYKERTVYLDDGTPVEFTYCYNRGDRYTLTVVLAR
jgi:GntR family transcriptional regulator